MLNEEPRSYTYLLEHLKVESGHLAYHLRHMGGVVEKDDSGLYTLTKLGWEAYTFMEQDKPPDEEKPLTTHALMAYGVALILVIILSSSAIIFSSSSPDLTGAYLEESRMLVDRSLGIVYEVFDQRYIDRGTWNDMTITIIKLQDRLEKLGQAQGEPFLESEEIITYVEAFTGVMSTPAQDFPEATIENRPLIREYHSLLIELKTRLMET